MEKLFIGLPVIGMRYEINYKLSLKYKRQLMFVIDLVYTDQLQSKVNTIC